MNNIFGSIPCEIDKEIFTDLFKHENIRIERIVSKGQISPENGYYDQNENEWVMVLQGAGIIAFDDDSEVKLEKGDYLNIPKNKKHKVTWTDPDFVTIWLAIFY
mgnify:CR=1 FL=1